jgi:hypothetical protein
MQRSLSRGKPKDESIFPPVKGQMTHASPDQMSTKYLMDDLKRKQYEIQKNLEIMLNF